MFFRRQTALLTVVFTMLVLPSVPASDDPSEETSSTEETITAALGHEPFTERDHRVSWYVGNNEFMLLEPAASGDRSQGWIVAVEGVGTGESLQEEYRLLFRDGTAVAGEHITYTSSGDVASRRRVDEDGSEILSERLTYRGDGTVRSVQRCDPEGCLTARFSPPGTGGNESIIGSSLALEIRFNTTSRPEYIRTDRDGTVTEEFLTYGEEGLTQRRVVRGEMVVTTTYAEGLLRSEEERQGQRVIRRVERTYDDQERPVREVETRRTLRRETQWDYGEGEEYVMERFENEELQLREEVTGDTTVRTHFRDGDPVFRESLVAGEVIRREIFVGGEFEEEDPR